MPRDYTRELTIYAPGGSAPAHVSGRELQTESYRCLCCQAEHRSVLCWPERVNGRLVKLSLAPPCDRQIGFERYGRDESGLRVTNLSESTVPRVVALAAWDVVAREDEGAGRGR
jgi:hypothetical protein